MNKPSPINNMTDRILRRLNKMLQLELGEAPNGKPNYLWTHTTHELSTGYDRVGMEERKTPSGIIYFVPKYETFRWVTVYGPCWFLAKWRGWDEAEWKLLHGEGLPFPSHGEYEVCGGMMPENEEPCNKITHSLIWHMKRHLETTANQHLQNSLVTLAKRRAGHAAEVSDEIDDSWPAYDHLPGAKDSVSLPGNKQTVN